MNLETMSDDELLELYHELDDRIIANDNRQKATKIDMNSIYGLLGNRYSRWCNYDLALAVTSCAQATILYVASYVNQKLSEYGFGDTLIYIDTDSIYLSIESIVDEFFTDQKPDDHTVIEFMDRFCETKIQPLINEALQIVADMFNAGERQEEHLYLQMKREILAKSMFKKAKKKYAALVYDDEGERLKIPKKKIMGLDVVRRETPEFVKQNMDKVLDLILHDNEDELAQFNKELRKQFYESDLGLICPVKPANNLKKYTTADGSVMPRTPYHVAATLRYNRLIKELGIEDRYSEVRDGEKVHVVYLKEPNPTGLKYIAWPIGEKIPEEFGIMEFIDWKTQFDKVYMKKVRDFTDVLGWRYSEKKKLSSFFKIKG